MADGIRDCPSREVVSFFRHRLKIRDNNKLARRFYSALAGHRIEDLETRFAAVASDMAERRPVILDEGPIIDAIEASIAIPVIARPVSHQGRYLLDGGFWDSAPVDAAASLGADVIVAVELGKPVSLPERFQRPATWLAGRLEGVPMRRTLAGVPFTIHAVSQTPRLGRTAQVVLRPRVHRMFFGTSPFQMVQCMEAGAEAALEALPSIRALLAGEAPEAVVEELTPAPRVRFEPGTA
jgi:predicted acylesterase/phospholipase RssA